MKKQPKLTLKEEFFSFHTTISDNGSIIVKGTPLEVFEFFSPHLKKKEIIPKIEIPIDKIEEFNSLWPEFKLSTGKYGRCSLLELNSAFQFFFKTFPTYNDWTIIIESARIYLMEREQEKWEYTRRSKYFIRREAKDKSWESELSEYYERVRDGKQEIPREERGFDLKIY